MADDLTLTFGANIEGLIKSVDKAGESVKEFQSKIQETGRTLLEVFGVALSVAGIVEFVKSMAELGEQAEKITAQLGINNEQFVQLSGIARLAGSDINVLALSMERLTLNIQRSSRDAVNPMAQALHLLGLNAKDFINLDAAEQFRRLTEAAGRFAPSMNLTNALMEIGGRGVARLVATLHIAGVSWDEFNEKINKASVGLADALPAMDETHVNLKVLETAVQSLGARIFSALEPAITMVIEAFTRWVESIDAETIKNALVTISDVTLAIVKAIGDAVIEVIRFIRDLKAELGSVDWEKVGAAALMGGGIGAVGGPVTAAVGAVAGAGVAIASSMTDASDALKQNAKDAEEWKTSFNSSLESVKANLGLFGTAGQNAADRVNIGFGILKSNIAKDAADFNSIMSTFISSLRGLGDPMGAINFGASKAQRDRLKLAEEEFGREKTLLEEGVKTFQITETQKIALLRVALEVRRDAEIRAGEDRLVSQAKVDKELAAETAKATEEIIKNWKSVADQIAGDFSSALNSVLEHQKTWSEAMADMFRKMIEQMIAEVIKLIAEFVILNAVKGGGQDFKTLAESSGGLIGALAGGGGMAAQSAALTANTAAIGTLTATLGGHLAATTAQTAATAGQTVATGASTVATTANTGSILMQTIEFVGQFVASIAAFIANTAATIANTAVMVVKTFIPGGEHGMWDVPSYEGGTPIVPFKGLAFLHPGEMVIPAGPAQQLREGGGTGGATINLSISAMDAASFGSWLRGGGGGMITQYVSRALQSNPSMRPGYTQ